VDEKKKNEILAFFWFLVAVLTLLALSTYTPDDVSFETSLPNVPAQNFVGPAGAYTAWLLIFLFGRTAYFLTPLFLFWALAKWSGKKGQPLWLRLFSSTIFLTSACALFSLVGQSADVHRFRAGGMIGFFTSIFLSNLFARGSILVALFFFLLSLVLSTELLVLQIAVGVFHKIKNMFLSARQASPAGKDKEINGLNAKLSEAKQRVIPPALKEKPEPPRKMPARLPEAAEAKPEEKPRIRLFNPKVEEPSKVKNAAEQKKEQPVLIADDETPGAYTLPPLDLLELHTPVGSEDTSQEDLEESSRILEDTLRDFGIEAKVVEVEQGPTIVRYELQPAAGVRVGRITSLENDIALAMRATSVRIIAPIPGKTRVGIEVPNALLATVSLKEVLTSEEFKKEPSKLGIVIGKDTAGAPLVLNLADMPHLLIAGATNTGKSVCINSVITSILYRATPEEVKFLFVDPKMVELHFYNDLPHLICPVVTDKSKVPGALAWLVSEMERRYRVLSKVGARNITVFNEKVEKKQINLESISKTNTDPDNDEPIVVKRMPYIVIVIDELADLMLASAQEVENAITRLAQLARAVGIHIILATQRPSVDVITGVIKANFPARIAFQVASKVDSRTILDENGADKLLGRGDLLLMDPRKSKLIRAQGAWVKDSEIEAVTNFIKAQRKPVYQEAIIQSQDKAKAFGDFKRDEVYEEAKRVILETGQASVSMVQRRLGLGYTRAARLMDMMEEDGVVGPYRGAKPREILVERPASSAEEETSTEEA
jgi:S-DNA-T family DNA segregation ATPase FtsK/SpoIIIE